MYRVGLIINENEASHSKYADTEATLISAIDECNKNGSRGNSYHFVVYDKFTINKLFDGGESDITSLNALIIATNALSFDDKLYSILCANRVRIDEFINAHKGLFVCSQKKLSNGALSMHDPRSVSFLPDPYDYYLFDRPERYSADGSVTIAAPSSILEYPYTINNELLEKRCTHNQFMVHKYRSLIIPKYIPSYEPLLCDKGSPQISQKDLGCFTGDRKVLLCSGGSRRIVVTTMALDWANHAELLCNIITFITEQEPRVFFVKRHTEETKSAILDSYMIRANIANIPYRQVSESDIHTCPTSARQAFVFSSAWSPNDIENIYSVMLRSNREQFTIYHISHTNVSSDRNHRLTKYQSYSSTDVMKDAVIRSLLSLYHSTGWGKSVWTYSYVIKLFLFYDIEDCNVATRICQELVHHFTKIDPITGTRVLSGDFDGVFNATCKMLEVLNIFSNIYGASFRGTAPYDLRQVIISAETWILERVKAKMVFDQDICYCLLYLIHFQRFAALGPAIKATLVRLLEHLLARIAEELLSGAIARRSSIDLCRIYQTLCVLITEQAIEPHKAIPYLNQIEATLKARQDPHGNWKHISETSEIVLMMLESYDARSGIHLHLNTIDTLIGNGIVALQSQYSMDASMWADDIGATAKAMHAIGLYDKIFNFSINDFLSDLKSHKEYPAEASKDLTRERIAYFHRVIDGLERDKESTSRGLLESENRTLGVRRRLSRTRYALASSLALLVTVSTIFILFIGILYLDHKDILIKELSDWRTTVKGAIASVIAAVVLAEMFHWLSRRKKFTE